MNIDGSYTIQVLGDSIGRKDIPHYLFENAGKVYFDDLYIHYNRVAWESINQASGFFKHWADNGSLKSKLHNWWKLEDLKFNVVRCNVEKVVRFDRVLNGIDNIANEPNTIYYIARYTTPKEVLERLSTLKDEVSNDLYNKMIDSVSTFDGYLKSYYPTIELNLAGRRGYMLNQHFHSVDEAIHFLESCRKEHKSDLYKYRKDSDWWIVKETFTVVPDEFVDSFSLV